MMVIKQKLENASYMAITWFDSNYMQANAEKFQVALFSRCDNVSLELKLKPSNVVLRNDDTVKLLGVYLDRKLSFRKHVSNLCRKAAFQLNAFTRLSSLLTVTCKLKMYNAFILSNLCIVP